MKVWSDRLTCIINSYSFGFSKDLRERSNPITVTGKKGGEKSENFGRLTKWGFHSERSVGAVWHGRFDYLKTGFGVRVGTVLSGATLPPSLQKFQRQKRTSDQERRIDSHRVCRSAGKENKSPSTTTESFTLSRARQVMTRQADTFIPSPHRRVTCGMFYKTRS